MPVNSVGSGTTKVSASSAQQVLKQGAKGTAVRELQTLLNRAGFDCGTVDGSFGARTAQAVRSFQQSRGLTADGVVGPRTWSALGSVGSATSTTPTSTTPSTPAALTRTLRTGCKGEDVKQLQRMLTQAGFNPGTADGSYGARTAEAVRNYQRSRGLHVDGITGQGTWSALTRNAPAVQDGFQTNPQTPSTTPTGPANLQTPITSGRTTTNLRSTSRSMPVDAPLRSTAATRSADLYTRVVQQFDVENNPRHLKQDGKTYCNIFAADVMRAMNVQLPHWVDRSGVPTAYNAPGSHELSANATSDWLNAHGAEYGWRRVSMSEATAHASEGRPALLIWKNPNSSRSGHVGVVIPSTDGQTHIAQAGGTNTNDRVIREGSTFGTAGTVGEDVYFWVHD